jgi:hypothetical protein
LAKITSAILCDFAQVRQSLLFVMSGGITRRIALSVPTNFNVMLAAIVEVSAIERHQAHEIVVTVRNVNTAAELGRFVVGAQVKSASVFPGESFYLPLVVNLHQLKAPEYGAYDVAISSDGEPGLLLTFYVIEPPDMKRTTGS